MMYLNSMIDIYLKQTSTSSSNGYSYIGMDPVSAIGIAGSVVSIIDVISRSLGSLLDLQARYKRANLTLSLLIGQLSTLKAALNQISEWIAERLHAIPAHQQLIIDLTTSLECCKVLILMINDRIGIPERKEDSTLNRLGKVQFLWEEQGLNDYLSHLNNQINALNLLLTALQWLVYKNNVKPTRPS